MPLRHDGSGGTRSARPPASTRALRTSHPTTLAAKASNLGRVSTPAAEALDADIKVFQEATGMSPFVALTRA
jgi:hypothetical protein